ncbi:hypothetical protein CYMTET_2685 [Cymbomonas tetramitiformis]|uniref:Uncharacterized protein n=1 Tax=Cymbomonas tetramitiformis TaxID=36881 RepID=A0AAE0H560_9CHLO|nr:hypothetical protein CYMTET_2685 [Cymbomonas tetramitiformis]
MPTNRGDERRRMRNPPTPTSASGVKQTTQDDIVVETGGEVEDGSGEMFNWLHNENNAGADNDSDSEGEGDEFEEGDGHKKGDDHGKGDDRNANIQNQKFFLELLLSKMSTSGGIPEKAITSPCALKQYYNFTSIKPSALMGLPALVLQKNLEQFLKAMHEFNEKLHTKITQMEANWFFENAEEAKLNLAAEMDQILAPISSQWAEVR